MWRRLSISAALLLSGGCSQLLGIDEFQLADAGANAVADAQQCYGTGLAMVCLTTLPTDPLVIAGAIDTAGTGCTQVVAQAGGPELCVIAATQITIDAATTITATGVRPLVLVATDTLSIAGTLDVSSKRSPARIGAGGNSSACTASTNGTANANGGGGGGGGSYGTKGGTGGTANSAAVTGGAGAALQDPTFVRGGCKGASGGSAGTVAGGVGGAGGGALYLIAGASITISGNVFASGAGAAASGIKSGGGGGGSGGLVGLEAPMIDVTGIIAANGGNASAGGGTTAAGGAGPDGATTSFGTQPTAVAGGATGGGSGGRGTAGAANATNGGNGGATAAGGGGGGGAGHVWVKGTLTNGTMISPAPSSH